MKKIIMLSMIAIATTMSLISCSDDDTYSPSTNQGTPTNPPALPPPTLADEQNATEEEAIPTSVLASGITVEAATQEIGTPPVPNSDLDFQLMSGNSQEAFQSTGFTIAFTSNHSIDGAYIQFKDVDGNPTEGYFDAPVTSFDDTKIARTPKHSFSKLHSKTIARANKSDVNTIEVNFGSEVPAGQFCYDICLYDASGSISQVQEVCVTVEAWGGNAAIVGEWVLERIESNDKVGEDINCENGDIITVGYEQHTKNIYTFVLNADGTKYSIGEQEFFELDFSATEEACEAVYGDELFKEYLKYSGNWAYNEEAQTLTVVDFKYEDLLDDSENEEYEDGELSFESAKVEINSSKQLVISIVDEDKEFKHFLNRK